MARAESIHGKRESLPLLKVLGFALVATCIMAVVLKLIMGGGPPSELLQRYEWEKTGKMFVYVQPEAVDDVEFMTGLSQHLVNADWCRFLFFDDRDHTPTAFPLTDEQTRHYRAKYEYNAMQNVDKMVWIDLVQPDDSPPGYIERNAPPSEWVKRRTDGSALQAVREEARRTGATTAVGRVRSPAP